METWMLVIIFEIIPVILWALSWYFENSFSTYPDTNKGIKIKAAKANKNIWIYGNKVAARVFSSVATLLFFLIAFGFFIMDWNPVLIAFVIFITICVAYMVVEGLIRKKLKSQK